MNKKQLIVFMIILLIGLYAINEAIYPEQEGNCSCASGDYEAIICGTYCLGYECILSRPPNGSCFMGMCTYYIKFQCIGTTTWGYVPYVSPCHECYFW